MRILTITRLWPNAVEPNHGVFVKERMSRVAARAGNELSVLAPVPWFPRGVPFPRRWARAAAVPAVESQDGIRVEHPRYVVIPKVGLAMQGAALARALWPIVAARAGEIDLIDAHFLYPDGFAAVEMGRRLGLPVVVSARGSDATSTADRPELRDAIRATLAGAAMLIAVSRPIATKLAALGADPSRVAWVPNGIDAETFHWRPAEREAVRAHLGVQDGERLLLAVGRLERVKGHDVLLEALAKLARDGVKAQLAIVGEGGDRARLEHQAEALHLEDRVLLAGSVPHAHLAAWYSAADLFCLPSRAEGHPNALVEALACGTPSIASAVGAVPDVLAEEAGAIVPPEDPSALASAIRGWIARLDAGRWSRAAVRATVAGRSWEAVAAQVQDVFEEARWRFSGGVAARERAPSFGVSEARP